MFKYISILILFFLNIHLYGQNANTLNEQSKVLLSQEKYKEAIPILEQAAALGNAESQYNLGFSYRAGRGIEQDISKGIEWFSKAADQGYTDGLYQMMMAYGNGDGVDQDFNKAFKYALQCAENGDSTCMWNIVNCYYSGMGVEEDADKMLMWANKLGILPNPENLIKSGYITSVRLQLAQMYSAGDKLEVDVDKSYMWYLIYNEFKKDFSYMQQQQTVEVIKNLEQKLTSDQTSNAKKEAEILLKRPLKNLDKLYTAELDQSF